MQSSDPFDDLITRNINRAANRLVRMAIGGNGEAADLFPELRNAWTIGPTTVGDNYVLRPSDAIVITTLHRAESSSLPDWDGTDEKPLGRPVPPETIGLMAKSSTIANYPQIWARRAKKILYWPTTRTGYTDYFHAYGLARITPLTTGSETFPLEEDWDGILARLAASMTAHDMGLKEQGDTLLAVVKDQILETANVTSLGNDGGVVQVEGAPTRFDVYGGSE
jgi:hypothetical protein